MSIMVKAGGGNGGNKYTGPNPLTIGANGYSFDPKTLLKDGLTIVNGVEGEDLTLTEADMALAITELQRMVARKVSENRGEGEYVWKKLTAQNGTFVDFVVNSDPTAYPDGGTQDGYWYERMNEGVSGIDYGIVTLTATQKTIDVTHNLNKIPSHVILVPITIQYGTNSGTYINVDGTVGYKSSTFGKNTVTNTVTTNSISFNRYGTYSYQVGTFFWCALE